MLKLKASPRELVLLLVLVALSMGVAWYYLLFTPLNDSLIGLKSELSSAEQQLVERHAMQLRDAQTTELLQKLRVEQGELQAQFDPISQGKDVIDYLVGLTGRQSWVNSLDIKPEQVTITILSESYGSARMIIEALEQSPSFAPTVLNLAPEEDGRYNLKLQAKVTWGQAQPGESESYSRTIPFGR